MSSLPQRKRIYFHRLHGQPVVQVFYAAAGEQNYCVFQQSSRHRLDFGERATRQELVQNQIYTKFATHHFNLVSWTSGATLFTLVSTSEDLNLDAIVAAWIQHLTP